MFSHLYRKYSQKTQSHCIWDNNIEMYLREIGLGDVDWINLAPDSD